MFSGGSCIRISSFPNKNTSPTQTGKSPEFDVYDSDFPICYSWGKFISTVRERRRPLLGEGVFRYYEGEEDFDRKIATCQKALRIAKRINCRDLIHETEVVLSYVRLAKSIYQVAEQVGIWVHLPECTWRWNRAPARCCTPHSRYACVSAHRAFP